MPRKPEPEDDDGNIDPRRAQEVEQFAEAMKARLDGRRARVTGRPNPFSRGSFDAYCWRAGYDQDVSSIDQLHARWSKLEASNA